MSYTYGGVTTPNLDTKFDDVFEWCYDDVWATKKVYDQDDPDLPFKYKYVYREYEVEDGLLSELALVMMPESLGEKVRADMAASAGIGEKDLNETDVALDGRGCVQIASKLIEDEDGIDNPGEDERVKEMRETVANCLCAFDGLRGFYLDKYQNRLGTTGWDMIREAKGEIECAWKEGLRRIKKEMGESKEENQ
jgi:hypothetical protein